MFERKDVGATRLPTVTPGLPFGPRLRAAAPVIIGTVLYLILALVYLDRWPGLHFDEAIFSNPALNLLREGNFGSSTMKGVLSMDRVTFWFLPLHSILLAIPNKLFGFGYWPGRALNVFWGLLTVLLAHRLALLAGASRRAALWLLFFLGTDYALIYLTRSGRMEPLLAFLHASVLVCLMQGAVKKDSRLVFLAGMLTGAALLTHPLGALSVLAFLILGFDATSNASDQPKWKCMVRPARLFAFGAFLVCLPYAVYVFRHGVGEFYQQMVVYQNYCYRMMNLSGQPLPHAQALWKEMMGSVTGKFFVLKVLLLGCLCWPIRGARKLVLLSFVYALILGFLWPGVERIYWIPTFYVTLAVCAAAGLPSNLPPRAGTSWGGAMRIAAPTLCLCVIAANLTGLALKLAQNRLDDNRKYLGQLHSLIAANLPPGNTIVGDPTYLFALPDYDLRSFLVVRTKMDLDGLTWRQALAEVSPRIILMDDTLASGLWPAFEAPPDGLRAYLIHNAKFLGAVGHGPHWPRGPIEVYKLDPRIFTIDRPSRKTSPGGE